MADAAREAGEAILTIVRRGFDVEAKRDRSPVTEADRAAELIILAALAQAAPGVPVIAEEEVAAGRIPAHDRTFFLVDPLDGTKEFVRGGDDYTVNIALVADLVPRLGVVFAPATGRLHLGLVGAGAWADDGGGRRAIRTRARAVPVTAVASKSHFTQDTSNYLEAAVGACGHVSIGSSLKFCIVAEGEADIYPRLSPTSEWDTAAGQAGPMRLTAARCATARPRSSIAPSSRRADGRRPPRRRFSSRSRVAAICPRGCELGLGNRRQDNPAQHSVEPFRINFLPNVRPIAEPQRFHLVERRLEPGVEGAGFLAIAFEHAKAPGQPLRLRDGAGEVIEPPDAVHGGSLISGGSMQILTPQARATMHGCLPARCNCLRFERENGLTFLRNARYHRPARSYCRGTRTDGHVPEQQPKPRKQFRSAPSPRRRGHGIGPSAGPPDRDDGRTPACRGGRHRSRPRTDP